MNVLINEPTSFEAFYVYSKVGVAGLTVTVDVYNAAGTKITDGAAATEIGGGWYIYPVTPSTAGRWRAIFKTAGTVDQQHIPSLLWVGAANVANLDAAISSRLATTGYTAPATPTDLDNLEAALLAEFDGVTTIAEAIQAKTDTIGAGAPVIVAQPYDPATAVITLYSQSAYGVTGGYAAISITLPDIMPEVTGRAVILRIVNGDITWEHACTVTAALAGSAPGRHVHHPHRSPVFLKALLAGHHHGVGLVQPSHHLHGGGSAHAQRHFHLFGQPLARFALTLGL